MQSGADTLHYTITLCGTSPHSGSHTLCNANSLKEQLPFPDWALTSQMKPYTCMQGHPLHHMWIPAPYARFPPMHISFQTYLALNAPHHSTAQWDAFLTLLSFWPTTQAIPKCRCHLLLAHIEYPCSTIPHYMTLSVPSQASIAIIRYTLTLLRFKFPYVGQISLSVSVIRMFILPAMFSSNSYRKRGREKWRSPTLSVDYGALLHLGGDGLWLPVSAMALNLFLVSYSWREYKLKHVFSKKN